MDSIYQTTKTTKMEKNIAHIKNLIVLACADGVIEDTELDILTEKAREVNIPINDLETWLNNANELALDIPKNDRERERHLINMINMSTSDGYFSQEEYDLCRMIAEKLPYAGLNHALTFNMNLSHLKNLVALACSDGKVDESELSVLKEAANNAGVSEGELNKLIERGNDFQYLIPESEEDRETQLIQMLSLAIADGEFSEDEYELCQMVAQKLGFTDDELELIIRLSFKGEISYSSSKNKLMDADK